MYRNSLVSALLCVLLLGALSISDVSFVFEIEESECREIEKEEEIKEFEREWLRILGGADSYGVVKSLSCHRTQLDLLHEHASTFSNRDENKIRSSLYLVYCALRLPGS